MNWSGIETGTVPELWQFTKMCLWASAWLAFCPHVTVRKTLERIIMKYCVEDFIISGKLRRNEHTLYPDLHACWQSVERDSSVLIGAGDGSNGSCREHDVVQTVESLFASKCHTVSRYTRKRNFAYALQKTHSHSTHLYWHFLYQISSISDEKCRKYRVFHWLPVGLSLCWFSRNLRIIQQHCV
jgi:hypothetical protein